jgi:hypothetical protein
MILVTSTADKLRLLIYHFIKVAMNLPFEGTRCETWALQDVGKGREGAKGSPGFLGIRTPQ